MGLKRAGFDVVGVDIERQPRYPFAFAQADALAPPFDLAAGKFDFIWASPPCQRYVNLTRVSRDNLHHPDLIPGTRAALEASGIPYCIENVMAAPIRGDLVLDGGMFGLNTWRQRKFELSFFALAPQPTARFGPVTRDGAVSVCGHTGGAYKSRYKGYVKNGSLAAWSAAMDINWMQSREMAEAIPPAYSEFIGRAAIAHIRGARP